MRNETDIEGLKKRLAIHRSTLTILLDQQAKTGIAHSPLDVVHNIQSAREGIRTCKATLRSLGAQVEDAPDDDESPRPIKPLSQPAAARTPLSQEAAPTPAARTADQRQKRFAWLLIGAILGGLVGYFVRDQHYLIPMPATQPADSNRIAYFGFEQSTADWDTIQRCNIDWSRCSTFQNAATLNRQDRGVTYELQPEPGNWINYIIAYSKPLQAELITASFYVPDAPDVEDNWVGIAVVDRMAGPWLAATTRDITPGQWTQLSLDLRGRYDANDIQLSDRPALLQIHFSVGARNPLRSPTIRIGLDDIAWYQGAGTETVRDQKGTGRLIFDFEDKLITPWRLADDSSPTERLDISDSVVYRGDYSLQLTTKLTPTAYRTVSATWNRPKPPRGGWAARLFLPNAAGTDVWANFYTYEKGNWRDTTPHLLTPGQWTTLVWDTNAIAWGANDIIVGIQVGTDAGEYTGPIYIDDIELVEQ